MKKIFSILLMVFAIAAIFTFCGNDKTTPASATEIKQPLAADETYTCTMHPKVMSEHPGKCPKCEMDLVKQKMTDEQKKLKENGNYIKPK